MNTKTEATNSGVEKIKIDTYFDDSYSWIDEVVHKQATTEEVRNNNADELFVNVMALGI